MRALVCVYYHMCNDLPLCKFLSREIHASPSVKFCHAVIKSFTS
jgi:hypothetical protein